MEILSACDTDVRNLENQGQCPPYSSNRSTVLPSANFNDSPN